MSDNDAKALSSSAASAEKSATHRLYSFLPPGIILLSLLYALLFAMVSFFWSLPLPSEWYYTGYLQGDQPTYTAWMREVFERGNGLFYANPFDVSTDAPRVFTNLGYLLMAWTHKLLPLPWPRLWEILRVLGGSSMAILLYRLMLRFSSGLSNRIVAFFFALALTGGGVAWLVALFSPIEGSWLQRFMYVEDGSGGGVGYGWWLPNLFRQPLYPLETLYHALIYGASLAYLSRRMVLCLVLIFLLWWTHPITATLATTILGLTAVADFIARDRTNKIWFILSLGAISVVFLSYNRIYIASFSSGRSLIEQTLALAAEPMHWSWTWQMWGIFLLAIPAVLMIKPARQFLLRDALGRFALCWVIAVWMWTHNNWFLKNPVQPMHFTRGHMFLGLILLLLIAVKHLPKLIAKSTKPAVVAIAILLLIIGSLDNVLFLARNLSDPPRKYHLMLSIPQMNLINALKEQSERRSILCLDPLLAVQIAAQTHHLLVMGDRAQTPFYEQKAQELASLFEQGDMSMLQKYNVSDLIIPKSIYEQVPTREGLKYFAASKDYADYIVLRK